jgi:hypothetical protein
MTKKGLEEQLASLAKEELVQLLAGLAEQYDEVNKDLSLRFVETGSKESLKQYKAIIKASIKQYSDRGFVFYRNVYRALTGARKVMEAADAATAKGQHLAAAEIVLCVLHEMCDLLQKSDDSGGDVGGMIKEGLRHLLTSAEQGGGVDTKIRASLFAMTLKEAKHSNWDGWNEWRLSLMRTASLWMVSPKEKDQWWSQLDAFEAEEQTKEYRSSFFTEEASQLRYEVLARFDGPEQANRYMEEHLEIKAFRDIAIEKAILEERYGNALSLIEQGELGDRERRHWGLVSHWEKKRAIIYEATGDREALKALAKKYTLEGEYEFFLKLKEATGALEWEANYEALLDEIEEAAQSDWEAGSLYKKLIIEEKRNDRLLRYVGKNPHLLTHYYVHLVDSHPEELHMLFVKQITHEAKVSENRKEYRKVCDIIRHLIKAGGREHAEGLIQSLREAYKKRIAFLDELDKIKLN